MIKRLALLCCILLLPTIAAAAEAQHQLRTTEIGGLVFKYGGVDLLPEVMPPQWLAPLSATTSAWQTDQLAKVFRRGSGLPMEPIKTSDLELSEVDGNQFALSFLARVHTHSWEMKVSPVAGVCRSSCLARLSSGQILLL